MMATSNPRPAGTSYIPTLDGWRAIAILAVMLCHGLDGSIYRFAEPLGFAGVLLFFAISGFLITSRMLEEFRIMGAISLRKFYIRRSFRILPPALFYLAVVTLLGFLGVIPLYLGAVMRALLFVRNYTFIDYSNPGSWFTAHFWSLSVEEHFYLIWPSIFILAGLKRARWIAPALAVATVLWRSIDGKYDLIVRLFHAPFLKDSWGRTDYVADVLLWGCALAIWFGPKPWKSPLPRNSATLVCLAMIWFEYASLFTHHSYFSHARSLVNLFMALLVGVTVTTPRSLLGRVLESAPLRYIGRLSYSLYLWQQLFFHVDRAPLWFQRFPLSVVLIFACAAFSYYLVERPTVRLGHRFAKPAKLGHADDVQSAVAAS
jgi:peptidoglycan/LPS O-acetylase OafA/YrhL